MLSLMLNAAAAPATPAEGPSQLLVLGMHHSGTSLVSNLTMMMGAYGGARDELLLHPENPLKFWERRDVVALDEARLDAGVREEVAERYQVPNWIAYGFDAAHKGAGHSGASRSSIHSEATRHIRGSLVTHGRCWLSFATIFGASTVSATLVAWRAPSKP